MSELKADPKDIINHLRDILDCLHYITTVCCQCGWVDHEDKMKRCKKCAEDFCKTHMNHHECTDDSDGDENDSDGDGTAAFSS